MRRYFLVTMTAALVAMVGMVASVEAEDGYVTVEQTAYVSPDPLPTPVAPAGMRSMSMMSEGTVLTESSCSACDAAGSCGVGDSCGGGDCCGSDSCGDGGCCGRGGCLGKGGCFGKGCGGCGGCGHGCCPVDRCWHSTCNMTQHYPYFPPMHGYYYFRPYNHAHIPRHQMWVESWGGDRLNPYSNEIFQTIYAEAGVE